MATRRNVTTTEKTIAGSQGGPPSDSLISDTRPAVSSDVIVKLLACTFAMVVLPLGSYFFTLNFVFRERTFYWRWSTWLMKAGNATYAGGFAALMANVVLIVYIVLAMREDEGSESYGATGVDVLKRQVERKKGE